MIQWIFNCLYHFIKSVIKTQQKDTANEFEWIHWNGFKVMQRTDIIQIWFNSKLFGENLINNSSLFGIIILFMNSVY